jgi:hypothetical protein
MFVLTINQGLEWHVYLLTCQIDYCDLFDYYQMRQLIKLDNENTTIVNVDNGLVKRDIHYLY